MTYTRIFLCIKKARRRSKKEGLASFFSVLGSGFHNISLAFIFVLWLGLGRPWGLTKRQQSSHCEASAKWPSTVVKKGSLLPCLRQQHCAQPPMGVSFQWHWQPGQPAIAAALMPSSDSFCLTFTIKCKMVYYRQGKKFPTFWVEKVHYNRYILHQMGQHSQLLNPASCKIHTFCFCWYVFDMPI